MIKEIVSSTAMREGIEALRHMTVGQLKDKYRDVFGESSRSNHKQFLFRRVAWRIQANAEGGISERARVGVQTSTFGRGGLCLKPSSAFNRSSSVTAAECSPGSSVGANDSAISLAFKLPSATGPTYGNIAPEHRALAQPEFGVPLASIRPQTLQRVKLRATDASSASWRSRIPSTSCALRPILPRTRNRPPANIHCITASSDCSVARLSSVCSQML